MALKTYLTGIADAIREKKGSSAPINAQNFASEISSIQTGGDRLPSIDDVSYYRFMDYDGTLMYAYTDEQLDALTELPVGPDHTDENLIFQEWNWTLADLKAWDRTRPDRPLIGANLVTADSKTYLYIDIPYDNFTFYLNNYYNVDWGDGTTSRSDNHIYATAGRYTIIPTNNEVPAVRITNAGGTIVDIKLGPVSSINTLTSAFKKINIPNTLTRVNAMLTGIKAIVIPKGASTFPRECLANSCNLTYISLPNTIEVYGSDSTSTYTSNNPLRLTSVKNIVIPPSVTTLGTGCFEDMNCLESVYIPDTVTTFVNPTYFFRNDHCIRSIRFPNSITLTSTKAKQVFTGCDSLYEIEIPEGFVTFGQSSFTSDYTLKRVVFPSTLTTLGANIFDTTFRMGVLDLSKIQSVVTLEGQLGANLEYDGSRILVPSELVDSYKSATNWSSHANIIIGV